MFNGWFWGLIVMLILSLVALVLLFTKYKVHEYWRDDDRVEVKDEDKDDDEDED